jgi:RepB DNA-primase from phage plasmid
MSVESSFTPQPLSAREYVLALFEPSDNVAVLLRHRDRRQTLQRIASAETIVHPTFQAWLAERNRSGADVFIGMNPLKEAASSRTKSSIKEIRHIYLDLDENARESLRAIRNSTDVPAPNFVLDTSPGKHQVVWKVEAIDQEQAESLLRSMANQFGGDPAATDSTRVLRMPGYVNRKYSNEEFVVRVLQESSRIHHLRDFTIEDDSHGTPRPMESERNEATVRGHKSQSEHDWAYAKRALSRGDDPEVVIQRIADFRADDKSSPEYYARLTVQKAKASLERMSQLESDRDANISQSSTEHAPQH